MLLWMIYLVVVSAILSLAAMAAERSARMSRAPARWLWSASLVGSLALPLLMSQVSVQTPKPAAAIRQVAGPIGNPLPQALAAAAQPASWLSARAQRVAAAPSVDTLLIWGWALSSGLMLLAIVFSSVRLSRWRGAWERRTIAGAPVLVSEDVGPAVVGLLRPRIVVPRWITGAGAETQALVVAHEQAHLDAHDTQLLAAAILLVMTTPWNLPLWWQLRRLRCAIEMDCDARVLNRGHDASLYGETLVLVGERQSTRVVMMAAMSEPRSFLEQRMQMMFGKRKKFAWMWTAGMASLGVVLAASAAEVSPPKAGAPLTGGAKLQPYRNAAWNFALDIPSGWTELPPVLTNSPYETVRFEPDVTGGNLIIVFRLPHEPAVPPEKNIQQMEASLAGGGFTHFVPGKTRIGSREVSTLDFDRRRPDGKIWSVRDYFIVDGPVAYTLGFGTTDRSGTFATFDRVAKSFVFGPMSPPSFDLTGAWQITGDMSDKGKPVAKTTPVCDFHQVGPRLVGTCTGPNGLGAAMGTLSGRHVSWQWQVVAYTPIGASGTASFNGDVDPKGVIRGDWTFSSAPGLTGTFTQQRR